MHYIVNDKKTKQTVLLTSNQTNLAIWTSHRKHGGLLNKHICIKRIELYPIKQKKLPIFTFPVISLWE